MEKNLGYICRHGRESIGGMLDMYDIPVLPRTIKEIKEHADQLRSLDDKNRTIRVYKVKMIFEPVDYVPAKVNRKK